MSELRPIKECLEGLRDLITKGSTGSVYLADGGDNIAVIVINQGAVEAINYQGRRGDFAVELLKSVTTASFSFHPGKTGSPKSIQLSASAVRWLTDGAAGPAARPVATPAPAPLPAPKASEPGERNNLARFRDEIESIAFTYLGPIASALCEEVFADSASLRQVVDILAANLPPNEAAQFRNQVQKATGAA
ncbi:MAG: hypothetical protein HZC22_08975 [Rhodocyclales bacterium]|nr:hypothetical protein [Rhodocyclales bacterium]